MVLFSEDFTLQRRKGREDIEKALGLCLRSAAQDFQIKKTHVEIVAVRSKGEERQSGNNILHCLWFFAANSLILEPIINLSGSRFGDETLLTPLFARRTKHRCERSIKTNGKGTIDDHDFS